MNSIRQRREWAPMALLAMGLALAVGSAVRAETQAPLVFSGGHETERRDGGRPITLVAAGLGVKPEVFRDAFSGVTPSRSGPPTGEQARANKAALMRVLQPYGITNERLDEVSNYYRYQPQRGELWRNTPARGYAVVEAGKVRKIVLTDPGAGYSSEPQVTVQGFPDLRLKCVVHFEKDLKKNGSLASVEVGRP